MPLLLVYARIQACLLAMPGLGERMIPIRVRVAAAMALTPLYAGAARPASLPAPLQLAGLIAAEIVAGLALGLMVRVVAMALDMASTALAQSASMSAMLGISEDMPPHPIGNLMHMAGMALLMALGLPVLVCRLLTDSFALKPAGLWPEIGQVWPAFLALVVQGFTLALLIASPFLGHVDGAMWLWPSLNLIICLLPLVVWRVQVAHAKTEASRKRGKRVLDPKTMEKTYA